MVRRLSYPEIHTLSGIEVIADDFLVAGSDDSDEQATMDHNANLETFLKECEEWCVVKQEQNTTAATRDALHRTCCQDLQEGPHKVQAILEMPPTEDVAGVR